jgi:hypothetical protein
MTQWVPVVAATVAGTATITAALTTVILNARFDRRAHANELVDDRRVETYVDALKWLIELGDGFGTISYSERQRSPEVIKPLLPSSDLESRVMGIGGPGVRANFKMIVLILRYLVAGRDAPQPIDGSDEIHEIFVKDYERYLDHLASLDRDLGALREEIQGELDLAGGGSHNEAVLKSKRREIRRRQKAQ